MKRPLLKNGLTIFPLQKVGSQQKKVSSSLTNPAVGHTSKNSDTQEKQQQPQDDDFKDGGYGWLVVIGAFMVQVTR
jgi:hypothetical protein